ncbi:MAG: hypothetical protein A2Y38_16560 [Spirochaetes bacterium GWB1_59_5]|nr:MAG: hypothetical protein A2Y38_16560 [Spirochaetes bacterium GWB1_59_5]
MADKDDVRSFNQIKAYPRGTAQGGRALQAVKGSMAENSGTSGHRTVIRETSEGRAIARTRDGMPMVEVEKFESNLYMETGHLEFSGYGIENPERANCAKWRFMDINPAGDYLGEIVVDDTDTGTQADGQPTPIDTGVLRDNIDSLAIGYPRSTDATRDAETKARNEEATVAKKLVVGNFPASLWSGKMRLFMQAQYGAAQDSESWRMNVTLVGTEPVLRYGGTDEGSFQLGTYAHLSPGIMTSPDGRYWLIMITQPTAAEFLVDAYAIVPDLDPVDDLVALLASATPPDADTRTKIEGYIFAHSSIDLKSKTRVGSYDPNKIGAALAYGWKFNSLGTKASIVLNAIGGSAGDYHLTSSTIHLTFSYTPVTGQTPRPSWISVAGEVITHSDWMDGWGVFNIFAPETPQSVELTLFSLAISRSGLRTVNSFSDVSIYGYYKDDVWTPVKLGKTTRSSTPAVPTYTQSYSGLHLADVADPSSPNIYQAAYHLAGQGWSYESNSEQIGSTMSFAFGGYSFVGDNSYGTQRVVTCEASPPGADSGNFLTGYAGLIGGGGGYAAGEAAARAAADAALAANPGLFSGVFVSVRRGSYVQTHYTTVGWERTGWAVVIPTGDAEAVYFATHQYKVSDSVVHETFTFPSMTMEIIAHGTTGQNFVITPWANAISPGWYDDSSTTIDTSDAIPEPEPETFVKVFNKTLHATPGTPAHSYYALFNVEESAPIYEPGMTMYTSFNLRYAGSEGVKSPTGIPTHPCFVGWA